MNECAGRVTSASLLSALEDKRARAKVVFDWRTGPNIGLARAIAGDALSAYAAVECVLIAAESWSALAGEVFTPFDLALASCAQQVRDAIAAAFEPASPPPVAVKGTEE